MATLTYTALCPNCGAAIYGTASGSLLVQCPACQWSGHAQFHYLPNSQQSQNGIGGGLGGVSFLSGLKFPAMPAPSFTPLGPDEAPEPDPLAARREALGQRLYGVASAAADMLRTVDTEQWQYPAWRDYERLQEAHAALYTALGGARMGDYHPARATLDERLASALLWALLTLDAVEG